MGYLRKVIRLLSKSTITGRFASTQGGRSQNCTEVGSKEILKVYDPDCFSSGAPTDVPQRHSSELF